MNLVRWVPVLIVAAMLWAPVWAHNNPTFREDLLLTVQVSAQADGSGAYSQPFSVVWPDNTVQLIWRVRNVESEPVRFSVRQDAAQVLSDLGHQSLSARIKGDGIVITNVVGAAGEFQLDIVAKVLDRNIKRQDTGKK